MDSSIEISLIQPGEYHALSIMVGELLNEIMEPARFKAKDIYERPVNYKAAFFVVIVWLLLLVLFTKWVLGMFGYQFQLSFLVL